MRESQLTGRLRLRHLLETTEAVAEEMAVERLRYERLADPTSAPRVVSAFNLFQTPPNLATRLVSHLDDFKSILEPSAGLGRIYQAIREAEPTADCTLVEVAPGCAGELYRATENDSNARLVQGDFLAMSPDRLGMFCAVAMNPPFKQGTDIRHILHALDFVRPGGRLVALCANGPRQRAKLKPIATIWEELPAGSFKSEGTNVNAALLVIDKP